MSHGLLGLVVGFVVFEILDEGIVDALLLLGRRRTSSLLNLT